MKTIIKSLRYPNAITTGLGAILLALVSVPGASAQDNTKTGAKAGISFTTGDNNTADGFAALQLDKSGSNNTASGAFALNANTSGNFNTATGRDALLLNKTGASNVAMGYQALSKNILGNLNTAIGDGALYNNKGSQNIALGEDSGFNLTSGSNNIDIGNMGVVGESGKIRIGTVGSHKDIFLAGIIHGDGSGLTGITGSNLMANSVTSSQIANGAVTSAKLAPNLIITGNLTLPETTPGSGAILVGGSTLLQSYGASNLFIGISAGNRTMSGIQNTACGVDALNSNTTGYSNTACGTGALHTNTTGTYNTASGTQALYYNSTGYYNSATGRDALRFNTTGNYNTASGVQALYANTTGSRNIALGINAGDSLTTGSNNIDIGHHGIAGESGIIRIGTSGTHTDTYLSGIIHGNGSGLTGITGSSLTANSVTETAISSGSVTNAKLAANAVQSTNIANGAVDTPELADGAVTNAKLAANAVESANIANSAVGTTELATGAVTTAKLNLTGNVGIGTATPGFPLSFGNSFGNKISLYGQSGNHYGIGVQGALLEIFSDAVGADIAFGHGTSGSMTETMRIRGNGNVGIGTNNPTKAKLEINGTSGSFTTGGPSGLYTATGVGFPALATFLEHYSLWASNRIAAFSFVAFSDERIKHIEGRSDATRDLSTLRRIEITDYTYIDTLAKGTGRQKKVIAQQVEKVYPQAVSGSTDVVPDIYRKAEVRNGWVNLETNLKKGERVRLIGNKKEGIHEVLEVEKGRFRTGFAADGDVVFVYGREVKDFRSVDYEAIAMLNVSATQELARKVEARDAEIAVLTTKLATLEARDQDREARLARLESKLTNSSYYTSAVSNH